MARNGVYPLRMIGLVSRKDKQDGGVFQRHLCRALLIIKGYRVQLKMSDCGNRRPLQANSRSLATEKKPVSPDSDGLV
jgi:hypothetical protein